LSAARISATITREARSNIDRAKAMRVAVLALMAKNRLNEAIDLGIMALRALGIRKPSHPSIIHIYYYFFMARLAFPRRKWKKLFTRPQSESFKQSLIMSIYLDLGLAAFGARPNLTVTAVLDQTILISKSRISPQSAAVMAGYGFLLEESGKSDYKELTFLQISTTAISAILVAGFLNVYDIEPVHFVFTNNLLFGLAYTSLLATLLTTILHTKYQEFVSPTKTSIIFSFEPVFAAIFAYFALNETISAFGLLGGAFMFAGLLVSELYDNWSKKGKEGNGVVTES
jgi:predicted ATPase